MSWYFLRPDAISVWKNKEVVRRLSHYKAILDGKRPARYRVVKRIPVEYSKEDSLKELFKIHEEKSKEFWEIYDEIAAGKRSIEDLKYPPKSFLDLKITIVKKIVEKCHLCEWRCGVNRWKGEKGVCGLDYKARVASAFLHMGEEAPLVPSGTIFFTGCSFRCVFCQNWDISTRPENGVEVTSKELAEIATNLHLKGAKNINYVGGNPDQQLHVIVESLKYMDVNTPLLWNSNMYMTEEALNILLDIVDIWLPDFKYGNNKCAKRLSGINNYFDVISRNHKKACMKGDMIIRHLVLPNHLDCCTKPVLKWIADNCKYVLVNIMDQYRPEHLVARYPERWPDIARSLHREEIEEAYHYADELGLCWRPVS